MPKFLKMVFFATLFLLLFVITGCATKDAYGETNISGMLNSETSVIPTPTPDNSDDKFYTEFDVSKYDYSQIQSKDQKDFTKKEWFAYCMRKIETADFSGQYANASDRYKDYFFKDSIYVVLTSDSSDFHDSETLLKNGLTYKASSINAKIIYITSDGTKESLKKTLILANLDKNVLRSNLHGVDTLN